MNSYVIKAILVGALFGAALFAAPFFVLKVLVFILIAGFIIRLIRGRRYGKGHWGYWGHPRAMAYADKIRSMTDEEYEEFKNKWGNGGNDGWEKKEDED